MQGSQINNLAYIDTVNAFMKKLELWKINREYSIFHMFPTYSNETEDKLLLIKHLGTLQEVFIVF
jgi:hypothetical protein